MISRTKLESITKIITHGPGCADGVASAVLLHDVIPDAEVRFLQYGTEAYRSQPAEEGLLFCDIAPPAERVQEFVAAGSLCFDHHKTARAVVEAFGENGVFGDETTEPGVCGAVLAFRHVWRPLKSILLDQDCQTLTAEAFAALAGVRDTWQRQDPRWRDACSQREMLLFFSDWLSLPRPIFARNDIWSQRFGMGALLLARHERAVVETAGKVYRFTSAKGTRVAVFQGVSLSSDVAEFIGPEVDLVVAFSYECEAGAPKLILSTRSRGDFDCASFCEDLGGGGHTRAAGCSMPVHQRGAAVELCGDPYVVVEELVGGWESSR